jgi:indole-3-glycerol phosphate synthase
MGYHREQLPKIKRNISLSDLRALASVAPPTVDFCAALKEPGVSLIAECKKASPSKGLIVEDYDPVALARTYVRAGARAVSVLTDSRYFQGSLADLRDVKETLFDPHSLIPDKSDQRLVNGIPVLRKDFIFDPYQVFEARAAGADAILLIVAVLEGGELRELIELGHQLGMDALIEVHNEEELERALALQPRIIGINNRDLQTYEVDIETSLRLVAHVPDGVVTVSESGIKSAGDVRRLRDMGVEAVLVGEALVRCKDVDGISRMLVKAGRLNV